MAGVALGIVRQCCSSSAEPGLHLCSRCMGLVQPFLLSELDFPHFLSPGPSIFRNNQNLIRFAGSLRHTVVDWDGSLSLAPQRDLEAKLWSEHPCGAVPCTGAGLAWMLQPGGTTTTLSQPRMVHASRVGEMHGETL